VPYLLFILLYTRKWKIEFILIYILKNRECLASKFAESVNMKQNQKQIKNIPISIKNPEFDADSKFVETVANNYKHNLDICFLIHSKIRKGL
jgi:hypothetical protein